VVNTSAPTRECLWFTQNSRGQWCDAILDTVRDRVRTVVSFRLIVSFRVRFTDRDRVRVRVRVRMGFGAGIFAIM